MFAPGFFTFQGMCIVFLEYIHHKRFVSFDVYLAPMLAWIKFMYLWEPADVNNRLRKRVSAQIINMTWIAKLIAMTYECP